MTPIAQRIAIAEACGWTNIDKYLGREPLPFTREFLGGTDDGLAEGEDTLGHEIKHVPDYLNDLNAIHEAEKTLMVTQCGIYSCALESITHRDDNEGGSGLYQYGLLHANAAQRAEAFLHTIGKWTDRRQCP